MWVKALSECPAKNAFWLAPVDCCLFFSILISDIIIYFVSNKPFMNYRCDISAVFGFRLNKHVFCLKQQRRLCEIIFSEGSQIHLFWKTSHSKGGCVEGSRGNFFLNRCKDSSNRIFVLHINEQKIPAVIIINIIARQKTSQYFEIIRENIFIVCNIEQCG